MMENVKAGIFYICTNYNEITLNHARTELKQNYRRDFNQAPEIQDEYVLPKINDRFIT